MAFYEMLPGAGMPSGLQAGMDSVLNKKFGTSTTYPAEGWPDTVNLMGPLPEKTVSSSPIVTFSDGADAAPLKKCEITLPASLDGYSEVDVLSAGKNLLDVSTAQGTGTIWFHYDNGIKLKKGVAYTFSCGNYGSGSISFYGLDHTTQIAYAYISASSAKVTYTPTEDIIVVPRIYQSGLTVSGLVDVMLEVGSSATTYEPYTAPTTHTASLGRTIYDGTADVVKGEGKGNYAKVVFDGSQPSSEFGITTHTGFTQVSWIPYISIGVGNATFVSDTFEQVASIAQVSTAGKMWNSTVPRMFLSLPDTVQNASQAVTWFSNNPTTILYPIATPSTFTFDTVPIDSKLGNNTIWSEQGSSAEVTYRADINLALGGN